MRLLSSSARSSCSSESAQKQHPQRHSVRAGDRHSDVYPRTNSLVTSIRRTKLGRTIETQRPQLISDGDHLVLDLAYHLHRLVQ